MHFNLMFGIWLYCVIFVFTNLENCYIPFKKGVYLFPLKYGQQQYFLFHPIIITREKIYIYIYILQLIFGFS